MDKKDCFYLGHVSKTFGLKGELVFYLDVDVPGKYANLKSVFIDQHELLVEIELESLRLKQNMAFVKIKGIDKIEEAEKFLKSEIYLPTLLLPELGDKNFYLHEVVGFEVHDKLYGNIGKIKEIIDVPSQRLMQIFKEKIEILIPVNPLFIDKVDRIGKIIYISPPDGLLDVYLNPKNQAEE